MDLTITLGWWAVPAAFTVACYAYAISKFQYGGGDYSFPEAWNFIRLIIAAIPVLVAWLIWALLA